MLILVTRYTDFIVNEIAPDGTVVHLTTDQVPRFKPTVKVSSPRNFTYLTRLLLCFALSASTFVPLLTCCRTLPRVLPMTLAQHKTRLIPPLYPKLGLTIKILQRLP